MLTQFSKHLANHRISFTHEAIHCCQHSIKNGQRECKSIIDYSIEQLSNFVSSYACMACNLKKRDNVLSPTIGGWTVNCFIATAFCYGFVCFACMCACAFIQTRKRNTACSIASMYIYSVIRVSVLFICLFVDCMASRTFPIQHCV